MAPSVRLKRRAIFGAGVFCRANALNSRMSSLDQLRLLIFFTIETPMIFMRYHSTGHPKWRLYSTNQASRDRLENNFVLFVAAEWVTENASNWCQTGSKAELGPRLMKSTR
jgi:hypothetical protein